MSLKLFFARDNSFTFAPDGTNNGYRLWYEKNGALSN